MAVEVWANAATGIVTAGGTNAPAAGTVQTWTVNVSSAFGVASTVASPQTQFYAADPLAPGEVFLVTVAPGGTGSQSWTVTRGADGTTPTTHALNFQVIQATARATLQVLARPWQVQASGDTTGAADSTSLKGALAGSSAIELVPGATYYVTQGQVSVGLGQRFRGNGATIKLAGASAGPALSVFSGTGSNRFLTMHVDDVIIDGTGGAANSVGLQCGDDSQIALNNVRVQNFGGGTGVGFSFINTVAVTGFTEQLHGQIYAVNCDQCMLFSVTTGSTSFQRMALDFWGEPNAGGWLCIMRNAAQFLNGRLAIRGNIQGALGGVLFMQGTSNIQQAFQLDIGVENDATSGTGPQTINFASASNTIDAYGQMQFLQVGGGTAWTQSNNNGNFNYQGNVYGDPTLQTKARNFQYTQITTGFPAGWSGTVAFKKNWDSGDVSIIWEFTITAATVVSVGETILAAAAFGAPFTPSVAKNMSPTAATGGGLAGGTFAGLQVTTGGGLIFQGAGFTPAGTSAFWFGQGVYSNSL